MIDFMVLALPRSGTTWVANWLTTETSLCLHDPLFRYHYEDLDKIDTTKSLGVSCTGLYRFSDWVNKHPAKKIVLHRNLNEVNKSLNDIGLPSLTSEDEDKLASIDGIHIKWDDVFNNPKPIYEYLINKPFDVERHTELKEIEMQPLFSGLTINKDVTRKLIQELNSI